MNFLKSKRKVSLVLGSGGARGLTQIGVIKALVERGYVIDEVIGCSIGSLIGAAYVQGKIDDLEGWMRKMTKVQVFRLMDFTNPKFGLLKGSKVLESMKLVFPDILIEEMPLRYVAVATDLKNEVEVLFEQGSVYEAIRASIAIPAVFTGVDREDQYLVDGGVLNPLPLCYVKRRRRNIVVAVNLEAVSDPAYGPMPTEKKIDSVTALQEAYFAMRRRLCKLSIERYRPEYVVDIPTNIAGIWDYHRADFLIEKGYDMISSMMPDVKK